MLLGLASVSWGKVPVILSTDVGNEIDDQWAITYMLLNPDFDVQGIISAHAPSLPDPSAHSTYEVLVDVVEHRLGMLTHPPLFEGSSLPLADTRTPRPNSGVDFIIETSRRFSQDNRLAVLTIGAATDVASALLKDPSVAGRIRVVAMGFRNLTEAGKEYKADFSGSWVIWDIIVMAQEEKMTTGKEIARPRLTDSLSFAPAQSGTTITWITSVDSKALWADFLRQIDEYQRTHAPIH